MLFVCHPKILHKRCFQFLLGPFQLPRETEDNAHAKFWGVKQRALWYVIVFLEWSISNFQKSRILWHCCFLPALEKQKHTYWSVRVRRSRCHRLWFKLLVFKHQLLLCRANASLYGNKLLKLGKPEEKKINTSKSKRTRSTSNNHMLPCPCLPRWLIFGVWTSHETLSLVFDILIFWISGPGCSKGNPSDKSLSTG